MRGNGGSKEVQRSGHESKGGWATIEVEEDVAGSDSTEKGEEGATSGRGNRGGQQRMAAVAATTTRAATRATSRGAARASIMGSTDVATSG
ncbi:hypothetical protein BHM03_00005990 [Ensete ventricosum]|uniref:Uncharacterized protein n=1 Tax=Ensete ventricosum TaxID=4639 RepID=A0A445MBG5_ENSVE|nr:hypothetical protein BHM03_00005990 [Ensete ventricosum]